MESNNKELSKNVLISIFVQIISLLVSFILNLVVPRCIPELQYAHWQTYVLYVGYVGVLHFGLLDGIVLRYSQYDYDQLDKIRIRSQFKLLLFLNSIMAGICFIIAIFTPNIVYKSLLMFVGTGIITKNLFTYTSYTFQITNRISKYAILVLSQRIFFCLMVISLLALKIENFYLYCISDLAADLFGCAVGYFFNKDLYFGHSLKLNEALKEFYINASSGLILLIANWSSMLLVGSAKMIVQWHWDELTFGKVSFSFSLSNLFLTFVTAISVVLFPSLKRMDVDKLPQLYTNIRNAISPVLFFAMILYFPGYIILDRWLPKYHNSLVYLGILLPIIIYSSKVSLLTNNYLKAYREEKKMLFINILSLAVAFVLFALSAYVFNSLTAVLVCIVFAIMLRSVLSEIIVMKIINVKLAMEFIIEAILTIVFIICARMLPLIIGFIVYLFTLTIYFIYYRNNIKMIFNRFKPKQI